MDHQCYRRTDRHRGVGKGRLGGHNPLVFIQEGPISDFAPTHKVKVKIHLILFIRFTQLCLLRVKTWLRSSKIQSGLNNAVLLHYHRHL